MVNLDVYHQLSWIREALATGRLPLADVWAYTPTLPIVVHHEWGTGAVLYAVAVASGWGLAGLAALWLVLYLGTLVLASVAARLRGASGAVRVAAAPFALVLLAPGLSPVRAQMFSFLFVALLLVCVELDRRGARAWVWGWLLACLLWVNLHGGFVAGYALFALYTFECFAAAYLAGRRVGPALRRTAHLWAAGAAMALAACATPFGMQNVTYLFHALSIERPMIAEWAPVWSVHAQPQVQVAFILSLVFALYPAMRARQLAPGATLLLAAAWMAAQHQRFLPIYAVVWFALVPALLTRMPFGSLLARWARRRVVVGALAAVLLLVSGMQVVRDPPWELSVPTAPVRVSGEPWAAPAGAVGYLHARGFRGNLMTDFDVGAYVSWRLHPAVRVGMDSRYEAAYPPGALEENVALYLGRDGWRATLDRYPTDAVLVPEWSPLDTLLARTPGWKRVYRDDAYSVVARTDVAARLPSVDRSNERIVARFP